MIDALIAARPLLATLAGVIGLLFLIMARRMPAFPALLIASIFTALAAGLAPEATFSAIQSGMGGVLGFIAIVVGLGALLSVYLEMSGGAGALARVALQGRSNQTARWAMGFIGILISIPVFFDVGLILMFPMVIALARRARSSPLVYGLPLLAGLAAGHAFIPPTPGPVAVAEILNAELGWVILFGGIAAIPAVIVGGPIYAKLVTNALPSLPSFQEVENAIADTSYEVSDKESAKLALSALSIILIPLFLIISAAVVKYTFLEGTILAHVLSLIGHPFSALLIACGFAWLALRPKDNAGRERLSEGLTRAFEPTAAIILVTGAGGAFKQVLIDTGAGAALAELAVSSAIPPLVAGFVLATLVRVAQGSATVSMLTAAGLLAPLTLEMGLGPLDLALLTVAIAAGASVLSHVNDSGFWLVSKYFELTPKQTLYTWTVSSTLVGGVGFLMVLLLSLIV